MMVAPRRMSLMTVLEKGSIDHKYVLADYRAKKMEEKK